MQQNNRTKIVMVLAQQGAVAFFVPTIPDLIGDNYEIKILTNQCAKVNFESRASVLVESFSDDESVAEKLGKYCPDAVISSASYSRFEKQAIEWAVENGIASAQLIDSWYDYSLRINLTNGPDLLPDEIWLFDSLAEADAIDEGLPKERLQIVGNPAWQHAGCPPKAPKDNILLIDQPIADDMGSRLGYTEEEFYDIIDAGLSKIRLKNFRLIISLHPRRELNSLPLKKYSEVAHNPHEALLKCGTVIGMFSSFLIDAYLARRNVISMQPAKAVSDMCVLSRLGLVSRASNSDELVRALDQEMVYSDEIELRFRNSSTRLREAIDRLVRVGH